MRKVKRSKQLKNMSVKEYNDMEKNVVETSSKEYSKLEVYFVYD